MVNLKGQNLVFNPILAIAIGQLFRGNEPTICLVLVFPFGDF